MKIVEMLSYDTDLTMSGGTVRRYSHEFPSIGLAITNNSLPILFVITDHEPVNSNDFACTFENDGNSASIVFHDKDINLEKLYAEYLFQGLSNILDEKPVVSEILEYPVQLEKFEFIKSTLESYGKFDFVRIVIDNIDEFNNQLVENLENLLKGDADLSDVSDTEMKILLDSNQLTFFDIFGIYDWIEDNVSLNLKNFPIKSKNIHYQQIDI